MIHGKTNSITALLQQIGYPSNVLNTSIGALLGNKGISNKKRQDFVELAPGMKSTKRSRKNEGCQSEKMYTTNDTPMGSNTKTSVNTNKTNRNDNSTRNDSRSQLLLQ